MDTKHVLKAPRGEKGRMDKKLGVLAKKAGRGLAAVNRDRKAAKIIKPAVRTVVTRPPAKSWISSTGASAKPLAEHSRVVAVREITEDMTIIPAGAVGTVINIIRGGVGYDVEFTTPIHAIVAAERAELKPA